MRKISLLGASLCTIAMAACATTETSTETYVSNVNIAPAKHVMASIETTPVKSTGDAADDPAIWFNADDPAGSLILGTDKLNGLEVYNLSGQRVQHLPIGQVNNVDVRQELIIGVEDFDLAVATNVSNNSVTIMEILDGEVWPIGEFATAEKKPYGICMGVMQDKGIVFVTHKTGNMHAYRIDGLGGKDPLVAQIGEANFGGKLEGCVVDDVKGKIYVGEEDKGIWQLDITLSSINGAKGQFLSATNRRLIDTVGSENGIVADIEGLTIYAPNDHDGYVVASSQGNNSFAVYDRNNGAFIERFDIVDNGAYGVDGTAESDGIAAIAQGLGANFPNGLLVVQDGEHGNENQNFKLINWHDIQRNLP